MASRAPIALTGDLLRGVSAVLRSRAPKPWPGKQPLARRAAVFVPLCQLVTEEATAAGLTQGEAAVLFTLRTDLVGSHKGQVSFPGGHVDDGETPERAALRELYEELWTPSLEDGGAEMLLGVESALLDDALERAAAALLEPPVAINESPLLRCAAIGCTDEALSVTGTVVTPVVGVLPHPLVDPDAQVRPSLREVDTTFAIPLRTLLDPDSAYLERLEFNGKPAEHSRALPGRDRGGSTRTVDIPVFLGGPERVWGMTAFVLHSLIDDVILPAMRMTGEHVHRDALELRECRVAPE